MHKHNNVNVCHDIRENIFYEMIHMNNSRKFTKILRLEKWRCMVHVLHTVEALDGTLIGIGTATVHV